MDDFSSLSQTHIKATDASPTRAKQLPVSRYIKVEDTDTSNLPTKSAGDRSSGGDIIEAKKHAEATAEIPGLKYEAIEQLSEDEGGNEPQSQSEMHIEALPSRAYAARTESISVPVHVPSREVRQEPLPQKENQELSANGPFMPGRQEAESTSQGSMGIPTAVLRPAARRPLPSARQTAFSTIAGLNVGGPPPKYNSPYGPAPAQVSRPVTKTQYGPQPAAQPPRQHASTPRSPSAAQRPAQGAMTQDVLRRVVNEANSMQRTFRYTLAPGNGGQSLTPARNSQTSPPSSNSFPGPFTSARVPAIGPASLRPASSNQASTGGSVGRALYAPRTRRVTGPGRDDRHTQQVRVEADEMFEHPPANPWPLHPDFEDEGIEEQIFRKRWSELRVKRLREGKDALERMEDEKQKKKRKRTEACRRELARPRRITNLGQPILIDHDEDEDVNDGFRRVQYQPRVTSAADVHPPPVEINARGSSHAPGLALPALSSGSIWHPSPHPYGHPKHPLFGLTDDHQPSGDRTRPWVTNPQPYSSSRIVGYGSSIPHDYDPLAGSSMAPALISSFDGLPSLRPELFNPEPHTAE
ncbi:uncharacterized protein RSE6_03613 [Rhynchosporium secalis]|uniref:PEHE domain-containing protein n=1 Tax=Rhynchosporium secalis TaxID=38038 RepID=A0A1E1M375_RHYSE|nr:uncharacterized protein RSE6_03613 [Rhynchosporium secalis]